MSVIEGIVGGSTQITIADMGGAILLTMRRREVVLEEAITVDQCKRLRKLLGGAEKRANDNLRRAGLSER